MEVKLAFLRQWDELFAAVGKLKIEELKNHAAMMLIERIDDDNALNILKMSNKYEHAELRLSAFNKFKACHPKIEFKDEWAEDVDMLIKILDAFNMKEEAIRKAEEEFKKLVTTF
ncbi:unnamed protein product [Chironomus riparius]|uniref:Uncharacterized protein n=1 Tax=Chironomus riparius TaxID=315576 RepID=A0A9N9WYW6_9DIPT|nr:unnamed protein product [Chironomus riparius]